MDGGEVGKGWEGVGKKKIRNRRKNESIAGRNDMRKKAMRRTRTRKGERERNAVLRGIIVNLHHACKPRCRRGR